MSFDPYAYTSYMNYIDSQERLHEQDYYVLSISFFGNNGKASEVEDIELDTNDFKEAFETFRNEVIKRIFNHRNKIEAVLVCLNRKYSEDVSDTVAKYENSEFSYWS